MYKKNIQLLSIFNFLLGFSLFAPLAIIYFTRVSGSYTLAASIFGISMLASAILEVPTGIWSDRVGRKQTIIIGSWARVLSFVLYAIGLSYWWLVAGAVLGGLSKALYSGNNDAFLHDTLADDELGSEYHEHLGKTSSFEHMAIGVSGLIGSVIAHFSFTYLLWISVLFQVAMLVISYQFVEPRNRTNLDTNVFAHTKEAIKLFVRNKKLRLLSIASIIGYSLGELSFQFRSAFIVSVWPIWAIGISSLVTDLVASASFFFSGKLIKRFSETKILLFASVYGKVINFLAYGFPSIFSPILITTPAALYGVGQVAKKTLMQNEFSDQQRATMSSLNSMGGSLGFAIMSIAIGGMADAWGPAKALLIMTALSLPTIYLYFRIFTNDNPPTS